MATRARPSGCCSFRPPPPLESLKRDRLVRICRALADPTRLEILRTISAQDGPVCACDIVEQFELSQPTISHHLKVLREAGLLKSSKRGLWSFYGPDNGGIELLTGMAEEILPVPRDLAE